MEWPWWPEGTIFLRPSEYTLAFAGLWRGPMMQVDNLPADKPSYAADPALGPSNRKARRRDAAKARKRR